MIYYIRICHRFLKTASNQNGPNSIDKMKLGKKNTFTYKYMKNPTRKKKMFVTFI